MVALRLFMSARLFLPVATQLVIDPDSGTGFDHQTHRLNSHTQQTCPVDWWVNLNQQRKGIRGAFPPWPLRILLAWCEVEHSLSVTILTANQLLKVWGLRLDFGVLGSYLACGMSACLKPGTENGSFQQVRLSTFPSFSAQPDKVRPNLQNIQNFIILDGGQGPQLVTWLYTIRRNTLRKHPNLVTIVELYFSHSHFNTVVPSTCKLPKWNGINK